jgi:UDP-4-amino-4,6-dideoxy-N-acetyl-beta-L-altrosamine transaminase
MIPYGQQSIDRHDLEAVVEALNSGWLTQGPRVEAFESEFARRVGAKHAVAVCNATAALHLAMLVARIGPGDRVVTSANTFLASANCAAYSGAQPDFCDIDPVTYNLSAEQLAANWQSDTKAVVAVDYAGQTADMPAIAAVARDHHAIVIEDACHAVGGSFVHHGRQWKVGGHPWADMTTFSFHPVKTMTTGEGGMLVTDNEEYARRARLLRAHGMTRDNQAFTGLGSSTFDEQGPWYYEMQELGFNFRITDFQCALGSSQLAKLDRFIERRREIVEQYNEVFQDCDWICIPQLRSESDKPLISWHLYTLLIDFEGIGKSRTILMNELQQSGIGTQVLYIPVYLQPWYRRKFGYAAGKCPVAEHYYQRCLSLPLFPTMTEHDVRLVIESLLRATQPAASFTNCSTG